ncbi:hypothetical protein V5N11_009039 [Cardamine amara subsp. amara]|uniref:Retrotransposon gag domain-containing protein n=1 Tax=Cardamine amara subsp. amara TaxID=228776 RepID=A0ABD1C7Z6_CARAN
MPMNPPTNNQKISELEDTVSSYAVKFDQIATELRESKKLAEERFGAFDSRFVAIESKMETRLGSIEDLLKQIAGAKVTQQGCEREIPNVTDRQHLTGNDSVHINLESPEEIIDIDSRKEDRDSLVRKVMMPVFEGVDAFGWIAKVERFFQIGDYSAKEKMRIVSLSLDGRVLSWYNWHTNRRPFLNWMDFKMKLLSRFGVSGIGSPNQRLFALRQNGSLADFVHEFEDLSSQVSNVDDENLECIFLNGLKPEIQDLVLMLKPVGLNVVIEAAVRVESRILCKMVEAAIQQGHRNFKYYAPSQNRSSTIPTPQSTWKVRSISGDNGHNTTASSSGSNTGSSNSKTFDSGGYSGQRSGKKLSDVEFDDKRRKGLCFRCDERYFVGHECKNKGLQVLTVLNGREMEIIEEDNVAITEAGEIVMGEYMALSMYSYLGLKAPHTTTKLRGAVGKNEIVVMLDSGATHNFISPSAASRTKLHMTKLQGCDIMLGTGISVQGAGVYQKVCFKMANLEFVTDFISLELGGVDVILGVQWLRTLGQCQMNWETHELSFLYDGQWVTLRGDQSLDRTHVSLKSMAPEVVVQSKGYEVQLCNVSEQKGTEMIIHVQIQAVLQKFPHVFAEPSGLPPMRGREHAIHLLPASGPISVRPYRYPHAHKEEMEKLVIC